jgi:hypothetical protein
MGGFFKRGPHGLHKRYGILGVFFLFLVLALLGYSAIQRPVIVLVPGGEGISVRNTGSSTALIYRVDGFWYWGGEIAMLSNLPSIRQRVESKGDPVRLKIPAIPGPERSMAQALYMRLVLRYGMPHIPIFRYMTTLHFEFDFSRRTWLFVEAIPPKYRALGDLGLGNVGSVELEFD